MTDYAIRRRLRENLQLTWTTALAAKINIGEKNRIRIFNTSFLNGKLEVQTKTEMLSLND